MLGRVCSEGIWMWDLDARGIVRVLVLYLSRRAMNVTHLVSKRIDPDMPRLRSTENPPTATFRLP